MKFAIVILAVVAAASAQSSKYSPFGFNNYNPGQYNPGQYNAGQYNPFQQKYPYNRYSTPVTYRPFVSTTPAPVVSFAPSTYAPLTPTAVPVPVISKNYYSDAKGANILKYGNEVNPDGSYNYYYETENGIAAQEQGVPRNLGGNPPVAPVVSQGSFSYTSPEGVPVAISYTADENGFQPSGNVLPVAPPIPELILRSLEYIARNPAKQ